MRDGARAMTILQRMLRERLAMHEREAVPAPALRRGKSPANIDSILKNSMLTKTQETIAHFGGPRTWRTLPHHP
jgi:hypothetical protein